MKKFVRIFTPLWMPAISTGAVLEQKHTHLDENADLNLYQFYISNFTSRTPPSLILSALL